jgi:hypothetical protein
VVDEQDEWEERIEQADRNRETQVRKQSPNFLTFKELKNRFQGTNSARMCSLAVLYDNPTRFPAPIDCLKIPALE